MLIDGDDIFITGVGYYHQISTGNVKCSRHEYKYFCNLAAKTLCSYVTSDGEDLPGKPLGCGRWAVGVVVTAMGTVGRADIVETSMEVMNIETEPRVLDRY